MVDHVSQGKGRNYATPFGLTFDIQLTFIKPSLAWDSFQNPDLTNLDSVVHICNIDICVLGWFKVDKWTFINSSE